MTTRHRPHALQQELTPWIILTVIAAALAAAVVLWLGGTLGALLTGAGWRLPPFTAATLRRFLRDPQLVWPGTPTVAIWLGITVVAAAATTAATPLMRTAYRRSTATTGLARAADLAQFAPKGATTKARSLRPSLAGVKRPSRDQIGMPLGDHQGRSLRASWEDVCLAFMAPRAGKTTALGYPMAVDAPGPVLITSLRADIYTLTATPRQARGRLWIFDPQQIAFAPQRLWWDMLADAAAVEGARRLASHFVSGSISSANRGDFWSLAAGNTLTALFHAAAVGGLGVEQVLEWLANPAERTPIDLLHAAGRRGLAGQLQRTIRGAPETRDGIYETAGQCVACLLDPAIATWVTPREDADRFDPHAFVAGTDTLYLFSKKGPGSAAPLVAAFVDGVLQAAVRAAEQAGGRLDPPLLSILDEAANICPIEDLPDRYSYFGGLGIPLVTILQSYRQGVRVWGEAGMDALWSAATIKILGAGLDDADFADKISRLIGDHTIIEASVSRGSSGHSISMSPRRERIYTAADVRALPKGTALLLATGIRIAVIRLRPWYQEPGADKVGQDSRLVQQGIAERARQIGPPQ
jgi:type IV secretory pathway TraG/TraD family ATPase VirD4